MIRLALWGATLTRVALLPVFVLLALHTQELARAGIESGTYRWGAVGVLVVIGLSDIVDGWLARRFDLATHAGAIADAIADKLVQVTVAAFFTFSRGPAFAPLPVSRSRASPGHGRSLQGAHPTYSRDLASSQAVLRSSA